MPVFFLNIRRILKTYLIADMLKNVCWPVSGHSSEFQHGC